MLQTGIQSRFIRVTEGDPLTLEVARIVRNGPHEYDTIWEVQRELPSDTSPDELEKAIAELLEDQRHFAVCEMCGEIKPIGFLDQSVEFDDILYGYLCHECMSEYFDVVF